MVTAGTLPLISCPLHRPRPSYRRRRHFGYSNFTSMEASSDDPIREWILTEGKATEIKRIVTIGGGCINHACRYDTDNGAFFVKTNREIGPFMFEGEAVGLSAMYNTKSIRIPRPFKFGPLPNGGSFIIMEFVEFGSYREIQSVLGRRLAEMHKAGKSEKGFGFDVNNTIGSTPQINSWSSDWVEFFSEHRLGYQLKLALQRFGDSDIYDKGQQLIKCMKPLFEGAVIDSCLLHGDLWSGNISADKNGDPVIFDPACYYGHNEAEFGMSWCAGFGPAFYSSYFEVVPAARKFGYLGIAPELEEKLNMMFSSVVASGQQTRTTSTRNQDRESCAERTMSASEHDRTNVLGDPPIPETTTTSDASKKRKKGKMNAITLVLEDLAESSRAISQRMPVPPSSPPHFTTGQALQKLHRYTKLVEEEKFYDFAVTFPMETKHRDTFMCLPEKADIKWLRYRYSESL